MATEEEKLIARDWMVDHLREALHRVRRAHHHMEPLPLRLKDRLAQLESRLRDTKDLIEAWPVTEEERSVARFVAAAKATRRSTNARL